MQRIEKYLTGLLYTYDCVTIPGFGGFIMHYHPARISGDKGRIFPPARVPAFNRLLLHDDGLLLSQIAQSEKTTYEEARVRVELFVQQCKQQLARHETVTLKNIGAFTKSDEGTLQFHPDPAANFLPEAFGMDPLNLSAVSQRKVSPRTSSKPVDRKIPVNHHKQPASAKWTLILAAPVILFLIYGILFPSSFQAFYADLSTSITDMLRQTQPATPTLVKTKVTQATAPVILQDPVEVIATEPDAGLEKLPVSELPAAKPATQRYHVIGGCFGNPENAEKFLAGLQARGFQAYQAGLTARGHLRISYRGFDDKTEAIRYLDEIKSEENPQAWLLKY